MFVNTFFPGTYFADTYFPPPAEVVEIEIIDVRRTGGDEFVFQPRVGDWKHDRDFLDLVKILLSTGMLDD